MALMPSAQAAATVFTSHVFEDDGCWVVINSRPSGAAANMVSRRGDTGHNRVTASVGTSGTAASVQIAPSGQDRVLTYPISATDGFERNFGYKIYRWRLATGGGVSGWLKPSSDVVNNCHN